MVEPGEENPMTYQPLTKPRAHQVEALKRIENKPGSPSSQDVFALLMEYGSGKSKVICDEWGEREEAGDLQDLLVIAGAGSYLNWVEDKSEHQPSEFHRHLSLDLQDRMVSAAWISGSGVAKKKELERLLKSDRPRALLMNVEAISSVEKARELCRAFLRPGRRAMMVVDESTLIKSPSVKRTEYVVNLGGEAAVRRNLTGWVAPNSPMDLYSQFEFLDWRILGHKSFFSFQARYAVLKQINIPIPGKVNSNGSQRTRAVRVEVAYRNQDELQEKIAPYSYRVMKDDCLDLPPKVYMPVRDVPLTDEQRRIIKDLRETATAQLDGVSHVTATMVLTRNLRIQQVLCGFVSDDDGNERDVPSNRGRVLMDVLSEHSGKAIIWCPFHRPLERIVEALRKEYGPKSVAQFHGKNKDTRGEDERRWLGDPECRWMVSTPAAGGRGNTWLPGTMVVYFANLYDLELRLNSEDRPHRDGQTQSVAYVDLCALETNELKTIEALREKIDMGTAIMGDGYKSWVI